MLCDSVLFKNAQCVVLLLAISVRQEYSWFISCAVCIDQENSWLVSYVLDPACACQLFLFLILIYRWIRDTYKCFFVVLLPGCLTYLLIIGTGFRRSIVIGVYQDWDVAKFWVSAWVYWVSKLISFGLVLVLIFLFQFRDVISCDGVTCSCGEWFCCLFSAAVYYFLALFTSLLVWLLC